MCSENTKEYMFRRWYIPERMMDGLIRYRDHGVPPGNFLTAIICNDFKEICGRADDENLRNLPAYAGYLYNEMPNGSHGSKAIMKAWIALKKQEQANLLQEAHGIVIAER